MDDDWPTERLLALFDPTHERMTELLALLEPVAKRWPDREVDATTLDAARAVLRDVERLTARLPVPRLLPLHAPLPALGLLSVLKLGAVALDLFFVRFR